MSEMHHTEDQAAMIKHELDRGGLLKGLEIISAPTEYATAAEIMMRAIQPTAAPDEIRMRAETIAAQLKEVDDLLEAEKPGVAFLSQALVDRIEKDSSGLYWTALQTTPEDDSPEAKAVASICLELEQAITEKLGAETWRKEAIKKAGESQAAYMNTEVSPIPYHKDGSPTSYFLVRDEFAYDKGDKSTPAGRKYYLVALPKDDAGKER